MEMLFDFNESPDSVWVSGDDPEFNDSELGIFPDKLRKDVKFLIRPNTKKVTKEILEKNTKKKKDFQFVNGRREIVNQEVTDWNLVQEDQLDHAIETWEGVNTKEGPIPCTRENKIRYADNYPGIASTCIRLSGLILSRAEADRLAKEEESEKNSLSGPNGQPTE